MTLRELELTNFRSYERARFELHPAVTLVVGPNASGKTNLLESLYVLASTKSFRAKDRDLVRHEQDHFRIVAAGDEAEYALGLSTAGGGLEKKLTHDGAKKTLLAHIGQIQVTLFEPTDLELVAGPPEERRKYLDFILCQTDRRYLKTLQAYKRVLRQRNALLEGFEIGPVRDQIFAWDVQLAELALAVYERRQTLLAALNAALPALYGDIAGEAVSLELEYLPSVPGQRYGDEFLEALARNLPRDLGAGFTTIGPHREDFRIHFKAGAIGAIASRGETRTVVLALKLAEVAYAEAQTGRRPLLLLDDVFSELDHDRRGYLLERLQGHQAVITTTDADAVTREIRSSHAIISTAGGVRV
ncbi:MAG TPA: DNA replication/repair protein RecF [Candidatus Saccharimonadia bacterium]|nr:DNA replication/repair protein RecF [Candidatus Saccharimonadia bacterium]